MHAQPQVAFETSHHTPRCPLCGADSDMQPLCGRCGTLVLSGVWTQEEFQAAAEALRRGTLRLDEDDESGWVQSVLGGAGLEHVAFNGQPLRVDIPVGRPVAAFHQQETWPTLPRARVEAEDDEPLPAGMRPRALHILLALAALATLTLALASL